MKKYIGTKLVQATPAIRKGGKVYLPTDAIPRTMEQVEEGYKVVYEDGYESWSPKDVFEKAYKVADTFLDRLVIEHGELVERCNKLNEFIMTDKFETVVTDPVQRELLREQYDLMLRYQAVLSKRVQSLG